MAGFEIGEKITCLKDVIIGRTKYRAGSDFPYQDMDIDISLVETLLNQKKLIRTSRLGEKLKEQISNTTCSKVIKNFKGKRYALSWPEDEPLPNGVIDSRRKMEFDAGDKNDAGDEEKGKEENNENSTVEVVNAGKRGFYNVEVDGVIVNPDPLRKQAANKLAEEYR